MELIMCVAVPVILVLCLLFACKWTNFSIIPEGLRIPPPKAFIFPKLKRDGYKWKPEDDPYSDTKSPSEIIPEEELTEFVF